MTTDFLIIGAGVAGLRAAIEAAEAGRVLVLTKDRLTESASEYAQGGIAVALSDDDEVRLHVEGWRNWTPAPEAARNQYELRSRIAVLWLIARCALGRPESRGAHYRTDFPEKRSEFQKHSYISQSHDLTFA